MKPGVVIAILAAVGAVLYFALRSKVGTSTSTGNPLGNLIDSINIWRGRQVETGGNTLPGSPFFGPDVDSSGEYTGAL